MKRKPTVVAGLCLLATIIIAVAHYTIRQSSGRHREEREFSGDREDDDEDESESGVDKELSMWFWSKAYPDPAGLDAKYAAAWTRALEMRDAQSTKIVEGGSTPNGNTTTEGGPSNPILYSRSNWSSLGPNTGIGGRILTIAISPANNQNLFAGSASGGIWRSTNGGSSWSSVTTGYPVLGVTSIVIDPANANIIFAGTGEIYRDDSVPGDPNPGTTGFNVWKTRGTYGVGVLRSSDGGSTWSQVLVRSESNLFGIERLRFNPNNPNTIYACATDGLYRSTDGGATWAQVIAKAYVSDVVVDAKDTMQIVMAVGNLGNTDKGIYKSTNNGTSWTRITSGLPASFQGSIRFDNLTSIGNRDTIVASIGVNETGSNEAYRSTNFGTTWSVLNNSAHTSYQYWIAHAIAINPASTGKLLFAGVNLYSYTISSSSESAVGGGIHADFHDIEFDPTNANNVYVTCDGGVYKSTNGGSSWSQINSGLVAVQFYASIGYSTSANTLVGGLQDNGVVQYNGTTWSTFPGLGGTDGAACFIDPANNNTILASGDARQVYRSTNGGGNSSQVLAYWGSVGDSRTAFVAPVAISKSNDQVMYVATDNLHVSTNGGASWTGSTLGSGTPATTPNNFIDKIHKTAIAMAVSPINSNKVYVSVSPFAQYDNDVDNLYYTPSANVLVTTNGTAGGTTPFTSIMGTAPDTLPNRYIMDFAISPTNDDSVWVAIGGFGSAHVYLTTDGGVHWTSKDPGPTANGLPDVPTNAIMIDPNNPKIIYVGNDYGVYVSPDAGNSWLDFNKGFWDATLVVDLVPGPNNKIRAATHGKGMFESLLYSIPLSVNLLKFTGQDRGDHIQLSWETAAENNLAQYILERSTDGATFQSIATIPPQAQGGGGPHTYTYGDYTEARFSGYLFYRLEMVNVDGTSAYSNVISFDRASADQAKVQNTVFDDVLRLQLTSGTQQTVTVSLYDLAGNLLAAGNFPVNSGTVTVDWGGLGYLPKGVYLVTIRTRRQRWTQKATHL